MKHIRICIILAFTVQALLASAQSNLLENGSFEADFNNQHYPRANQELFTNSPFPWLDFNPGDDERWYIDSIWTPPNINLPDPGFQPGYYSNQFTNIGAPWESGNDKILQNAHTGLCYIGFNSRSDWFAREGIQTKPQNDCNLNSGVYIASLWWARTYPTSNSKIWLYLSDQSSTRRKKISDFTVAENAFSPGSWYPYSKTFELKLNRNQDMGNRWFSITGSTIINSNYERYMYFDDVRLYRPCDVDSACFVPTGQICPVFATPGPPGPPMVIKQIENVDEIHVKIYNQLAQIMLDTSFFNPNGLPDFYFQPAILSGSVASGNYPYDVTLHNKCGGVRHTGQFQVQAGIYDTLAPWVDSTANWSEVPRECCLHTLTLRDMEIRGDVAYVVKDTIWIRDGVTAAPGSDILIQAGQVVELDSVEFDGTSTVEILSEPCQGCRLAPPVSGGKPPKPNEVGRDAVITGSLPATRPESRPFSAPADDAAALPEGDTEPEPGYAAGLRAYPNPLDGVVTLEVELPRSGPVSIIVYDIAMRPVAYVLSGEWLAEGIHSFSVDLGREAAGIYFVQLVAEGNIFTEKLVKR